jgi:hypothetical protein
MRTATKLIICVLTLALVFSACSVFRKGEKRGCACENNR